MQPFVTPFDTEATDRLSTNAARAAAVTAQTFALSNELNTVNILLRQMNASVLLIKALGGGWQVADLPSLTDG